MGLYNHERVWNACGWMICYLAFVRQIRCDFPQAEEVNDKLSPCRLRSA
jgi:hypothetical protein